MKNLIPLLAMLFAACIVPDGVTGTDRSVTLAECQQSCAEVVRAIRGPSQATVPSFSSVTCVDANEAGMCVCHQQDGTARFLGTDGCSVSGRDFRCLFEGADHQPCTGTGSCDAECTTLHSRLVEDAAANYTADVHGAFLADGDCACVVAVTRGAERTCHVPPSPAAYSCDLSAEAVFAASM